MNPSQHIKFWLGKITYFLLCYAAIVGTTLLIFKMITFYIWPISPKYWSFQTFDFSLGEMDLNELRNPQICWYFMVVSSLIISELLLRSSVNFLKKFPVMLVFVIVYIGNAINIILLPVENNLSNIEIAIFTIIPFACLFLQFIRYQFKFIEDKNHLDVILAILVCWPFLSRILVSLYETVTIGHFMVNQYDIKSSSHLEMFFFYGVPMFFIYPFIFESMQTKKITLLCSAVILFLFMIFSNPEIARIFSEQQFHVQYFIHFWQNSLIMLLIFMAPIILIPRILYWLCRKYIWKNKIEKPNNEPLPTH